MYFDDILRTTPIYMSLTSDFEQVVQLLHHQARRQLRSKAELVSYEKKIRDAARKKLMMKILANMSIPEKVSRYSECQQILMQKKDWRFDTGQEIPENALTVVQMEYLERLNIIVYRDEDANEIMKKTIKSKITKCESLIRVAKTLLTFRMQLQGLGAVATIDLDDSS